MWAWLAQIPPERALLAIFFAGVTYQRIRAHTLSLRGQGERLGKVEDKSAELRAEMNVVRELAEVRTELRLVREELARMRDGKAG
jgi:hypothetical protein